MTKRILRITGKMLLALLTIILVFVAFLGVTGNFGRPERYEITAPYQGWATVTYAKPGCEFLPTDGWFLVVIVDQSGKACTSSPMPRGWQYTQVVYVDKTGRKTKIPLGSWGRKNVNQAWQIAFHTPDQHDPFSTEEMFIGTEEQLKTSWAQEPLNPSNRLKELAHQQLLPSKNRE